MYNFRKILFVAGVLALFSLSAAGQTNEFKAHWKKIYDNVYYHTDSLYDKLPAGPTEFRFFGFKDKREYPASVEISGNVVKAQKKDKMIQFLINSGKAGFEYGDMEVNYTGNLMFYAGEIKKDSVTLSIVPLDGNWKVRDIRSNASTDYHIKTGWDSQVGQLLINVGKPEKNDITPPYTVDFSSFMLPMHVTKKVEFSREISSQLQGGMLPLSKPDSVFIHGVLIPGTKVEKLPGLEVVVSEMRMMSDPTRVFDSEILYYKLGDRLGLSDADIERNGADYKISYHGLEPKYIFEAAYHNSAFPEFTEVKWEDGSNFNDATLKRSDESRITQIKFDVKDNLLDMPQGYIIYQARALGDFTNLDFYDFNKYFKDEKIGKLEVGAYISPDKVSTLVQDGYIQPVRERVEAERAEMIRAVTHAQNRYDLAKAGLESRQNQLASEYDTYATGRVEFEIPNNQAADPHNVKVIRQIKKDSNGVYEELLFVNDASDTYPLELDKDGDACFTANGRTYWFTSINDKARAVLDSYRIDRQNRAIVNEGRPEMPKFD